MPLRVDAHCPLIRQPDSLKVLARYAEHMSLFLRGATLLPCDSGPEQIRASVHIQDGLIAAIHPPGVAPPNHCQVVDLEGLILLPGFVQTHTHLVQTLFRGLADDLVLLDWLRTRIWPLERAHDDESVYWSARLGLTEMLLSGTTAILDMGTVDHTDSVFHAAEESGLRATIGKAMMDRDNPAGLSESTEDSLQSSIDLADRWHGKGRLRYGFAPRFVPSCTDALLTGTRDAARERGCLIHTHASENLDEVALVRSLTGTDNIIALDRLGLTGPDVILAHCIHLTEDERRILAETHTQVSHCPSSNMKLGSGVAPIPELLQAGIRCTLGSDGAPCNNRMDMFTEMRLAALIQSPRLEPGALPAGRVLKMATTDGAAALGLPSGSIEVGRPADLIAVDPRSVHCWGGGGLAGKLVYSMTPAAVRSVWIGGEERVRNGQVLGWSTEETLSGCEQALTRVRGRAGL
jgi:cytosine/adenosine deaminase-related metal-dependent hydrolase